MKQVSRSEVEKAVVEFFRVCHRDLDPAAIEEEIEARMARLKAKQEMPKKAKTKPDSFLASYRLKRSHRLQNGRIIPNI